MALAHTDRPDIKLFQPGKALIDPYPIGIWFASRQTAGDATGGLFTWTVAPASAVEAAKYLWSVEDETVYVADSTAGNVYVTVTISTGERYINSSAGVESISFGYTWQVLQMPTIRNAGRYVSPIAWRPIHQPGNGLTNAYMIVIPNMNAILTSFAMWGFVWNPEARRLAGGPRKP